MQIKPPPPPPIDWPLFLVGLLVGVLGGALVTFYIMRSRTP